MNNIKEYGVLLKEKRERQGITFEQISNDTKISVRVLRGLENMEKDIFPSETYRVGMLRVYARYLSIDEQEILNMLKVNEIQEKPIEFDLINLQEQKKQKQKKILIISLGVIVVLVIVMFFILGINSNIIQWFEKRRSIALEKSVELERIERFYESNFVLNQKVLVVSQDLEAPLEIISIKPPKILINNKEAELSINNPYPIDLNEDTIPEYIVLVRSIDTTRNLLLMRFDPRVNNTINTISIDNKKQQIDNIGADGKIIDITSAFAETPIQISLKFKEHTYFKISTDTLVLKVGMANKNTIETITTDDPVKIYLANDRFVDIIINGNTVNLSTLGLPYVFYVRWLKQDSGRYILQAIPLP